MKFSSQEEYGLRCLLRIARDSNGRGLTIPGISKAEGISEAHVAKLLRILRLNGYLESSRGQVGGYSLKQNPESIKIKEVLTLLGGKLYDEEFCEQHFIAKDLCTNSVECSIRSLWQMLQGAVDGVLNNLTVADLISPAEELVSKIQLADKKFIEIDSAFR